MHRLSADSAQHRTGVSAPSAGGKGPGPADQDPLQIFGNHSRPLPPEGEGKLSQRVHLCVVKYAQHFFPKVHTMSSAAFPELKPP